MTLPLIVFALCTIICFLFYWLAGFVWKDSNRNILAYTAGTGNNGYFGLPLVMTLFSEQAFGVGVIAGLGFLFYESSVGLFLVAKSNRTAWESIKKILTIPLMYAFLAGVAVNLSGLQFPKPIADLFISFRGTYTVLGMMLIGLGIAGSASASSNQASTAA